MRKPLALLAAAATLAACDPVADHNAIYGACAAARTYVEGYGTPTNRGPCWGRTISHSAGHGVQVFMVQSVRPQYTVASLVYQNGVLVQAGETRGP